MKGKRSQAYFVFLLFVAQRADLGRERGDDVNATATTASFIYADSTRQRGDSLVTTSGNADDGSFHNFLLWYQLYIQSN
jgi:hypothetical protein